MRLIISELTSPVATWKTRTGAFIELLSLAIGLLRCDGGLQFGGAPAPTIGIELSRPFADRGEALEL
jgi:hypothetical protein